ncbi:MAG: PD-(D/E)XK nuclease family protein [Gemmatimonadaceae bacterium]
MHAISPITAHQITGLDLILGHDPAALLEAAAEGFLVTPERGAALWPTPPHVLAVRQGGLRDDLYALAMRRKVSGWFDPPLCVFTELPEFLGDPPGNMLGDYERVTILTGIVEARPKGVLGRAGASAALIDALDRLLGELIAEDITPEDFKRATGRVAHRDNFQRERDAEIAVIYGAYLAELAKDGKQPLFDSRGGFAALAKQIVANPDALAHRLRGRREIRILGLHDLRNGWRALLRALLASPAIDRVGIYTSIELDLSAIARCSVRRLGQIEPAAALFTGGKAAARFRVAHIDAPDLEREVEEVARRVRVLADEGRPLDQIAILARQGRPHVNMVVNALLNVGVPAAARVRTSHAEIPALRAVLALVAAAADGWSRRGLSELGEHPYFRHNLDRLVLDHVGYRRRVTGLVDWSRALTDLEERARQRESGEATAEADDRRGDMLPPAARIGRARKHFGEFASRARALDGERPLIEWLSWLRHFVDGDGWGVRTSMHRLPEERWDIARLDLAGWRGLGTITTEWLHALERWESDSRPIDACGFERELREMLVGDVALWTSTPRGVRVLEGLAAAHRSFGHVFLIGLETGQFPLRAPASPLYDDHERDALAGSGLPIDTRADWDARERELFRALVESARVSLTVATARLDARGRETVPSVFIDELGDIAELVTEKVETSRVLTPGLALAVNETMRQHAAGVARMERLRETGLPSPWNGVIEDPVHRAWLAVEFGAERTWSASQLESYAKCPWSYLAARLLKLESLDEPSDEMEHTVRGTILHDTMRRFFADVATKLGTPVFLREKDLPWAAKRMEHALDESMKELANTVWLGHTALRDAKRAELSRMLRKYLEYEITSNENSFSSRGNQRKKVRTGVIDHEVSFGFDEPFTINAGGETLHVRGSIDRLEESVDEDVDATGYIAAVDYKATKWSTPGGGKKEAWDDNVVLQVPLYAIVAAQLKSGRTIASVEYRAIKGCCTAHTLDLVQVDRKKKELITDPEAKQRLDTAIDAIGQHVREARSGDFPARPAPSCGCPDFCVAIDICRVKGGPKSMFDW